MHHWLVMYCDSCIKKGGVHILKSSEVLKRYKVSAVSSSRGIVLDLKLLFTIVDCFWKDFSLGFLL